MCKVHYKKNGQIRGNIRAVHQKQIKRRKIFDVEWVESQKDENLPQEQENLENLPIENNEEREEK